jgi:serine protease Do
VLNVNGRAVADSSELTRAVAATQSGQPLRLDILRDERRRTVEVIAGVRPSIQELERLARGGDASTGGAGGQPAETRGPAVLGMNLSPSGAGLVINGLERGSEAAERGIQRGDVISMVNGRPVRTVAEFQSALENARRLNRSTILVWITRGNSTTPVPIPIQPRANG